MVALAWKAEASQPAARVRLNVIAAGTNQALFAADDPEGRCASGPDHRLAWTYSMTACPRWLVLVWTKVSGLSLNTERMR